MSMPLPPSTAPSALVPGLVTVCMPTTGRVEYMERALADLSRQTYAPIEVLILDNASEGPALGMLREFARCTPGTRILRVEDRLPMFENFNRGIREARGRYIAFFHDDDEYDPTFLAEMIGVLNAHPRAVFAGGNYDIIDGRGSVQRRSRAFTVDGVWDGRRFCQYVMQHGRTPMSTPGLVFRADAVAHEGFDPALPMNWGDFTMLMRLAERGDVAVSASVLYRWRVHSTNASTFPRSEAIVLRTQVLTRYVEEFRARHPSDRATVDHFHRGIVRAHVYDLIWGWFTAGDVTDAERCRLLLSGTHWQRAMRMGLGLLERCGVSFARRQRLIPLLRRILERRLIGAGSGPSRVTDVPMRVAARVD